MKSLWPHVTELFNIYAFVCICVHFPFKQIIKTALIGHDSAFKAGCCF